MSFTEYHRPLCTNDREGLLCEIPLITSVSPSVRRCVCQPLQITTAIKHRVEPTPSPPQPTLSAPSECPYLSFTVRLYFSPILSFSTELNQRHSQCLEGVVCISFLFHCSVCLSHRPPHLPFFSPGYLSILFVFWASFGPPKYFRYHAGCTQAVPKLPVAPPHRQDCVKPSSKIHNLKRSSHKVQTSSRPCRNYRKCCKEHRLDCLNNNTCIIGWNACCRCRFVFLYTVETVWGKCWSSRKSWKRTWTDHCVPCSVIISFYYITEGWREIKSPIPPV